MLNVKQAYIIAKTTVPKMTLVSIRKFGDDFGFLFEKNKNQIMFGNSYILVDGTTKEITAIPTTPINLIKIQSAPSIPLTTIIL